MNTYQDYIPTHASPRTTGNVTTFEVKAEKLHDIIKDLQTNAKLKFKLIEATDDRAQGDGFRIWYVFAIPVDNHFIVPYVHLANTEKFPSITSIIHGAGQYERKIQTFFGLTPTGNPDSRQFVLHENWPTNKFPLRKDFNRTNRPKTATGSYEFQFVGGEGIYEIPVGPIHAGIIEPGLHALA
jgi:Ni,Fe-hydrogenase III component G